MIKEYLFLSYSSFEEKMSVRARVHEFDTKKGRKKKGLYMNWVVDISTKTKV